MNIFGIVNYWSVIVAAVVSYLVGWLWHGPLFGKMWMKLEGFEMPAMSPAVKKQMVKSMSLGFITQLIFAWGIAYFVSALTFSTTSAMMLAFVIWLAFVVTTLAGGWLWERKSGKLFAFNAIYQFVSVYIMVLIIALW